MIRNHDRWSKLGAENLGEHNIEWARRMEEFPTSPPGSGPMTLLKAILNDYWADNPIPNQGWDKEKVDIVMSKLYWCWVAWLDCTHRELGVDEEE
jgi:hypothetical protein